MRGWARALRTAFRKNFCVDDPAGGGPATARTPDGRPVPHWERPSATSWAPACWAAGSTPGPLLDKVRTKQLIRLHSPFGHRGGAVGVREAAIGVSGLVAAGYEKEVGSLLRGVLAAAEAFGHRAPRVVRREQRTEGSAPLPHPAPRCLARRRHRGRRRSPPPDHWGRGIRPDAPAWTVTLCPLPSGPLGEVGLTGLQIAGAAFSVRVGRTGPPWWRKRRRKAVLGCVTWHDTRLADSVGEW
ncbi:hypothetical protein [Streptomyces bobili]|uniref:hypothetical protein n=1 Tax=Streptomyces bobili TaxID=67280 RepID=UPI003F541C4C